MGGVQNHLKHLYDNPELSFGKIKKVLSFASQGKLEITEKLDGWNVALSFRDGKAVIARNKTDLTSGGMDAEGVAKKEWAGGENVKNTYFKAIKDFEKAINGLSPKIQNALFKNGKVFYNAEILGSAASNVVKYDVNTIKFHDTGHKEFKPETNEIVTFKDEKVLSLFDKVMSKIEQNQSGENFQIRKNAFAELKAMVDDKDLKIAKIKLDKIISSEGLSDKNTIEDYLRIKFTKFVKQQLPETSEDIINAIIENLLGNAKLPTGFSKELKQKVSQIKKERDKIYKQAIYPIEETIHDFSVELLRGFKSAFILDNDKETQRLKQEVSKAIQAIQSSNNEEANTILSQQLQKLKNIENITSSSEGVVFEFEGNVYKFTGNFAPINQVLGLFKYGRGKVPPLEKLEEAGKNKVIAIVPGGFKPPHAGHFLVAKHFADMPEVDYVKILISPKERVGHSGDNRVTITADMSLAIWQIYASREPKIKPEISPDASPVKATYDFLETLNQGDTAVLGLGEKEKKKGNQRFAKAQEYVDRVNPGVKVQIMEIPPQAGGVSGGEMRELVALGNKENVIKNLPMELSSQEKEEIWNILSPKGQVQEIQEEKKSPIISLSISKFISEVMDKQQIKEVSVKDLKTKYPDYDGMIDEFSKNLENKYVYPALRFLMGSESISMGRITQKLRLYDKCLKTGKIKKAILADQVDSKFDNIDWVAYRQTFDEFVNNINVIATEYESNEDIKAEAEKGNEKVYEDENYLALWIKSHYASCYFGSGTDWCITKEDARYWDSYSKDSHIIFVFNKSLEKDKQNPKRKTAVLFPKINPQLPQSYDMMQAFKKKFRIQCFDLNDKQIDGECSNVPKEIKSAISEKIYGEDLIQENPLEEMSSMSAGSVEGAMTKSPFTNFNKKDNEKEKQLEEYDTHSVSHEIYQDLMRKLHPKHKENLIGKGGQKADVTGSPYKKKPSMQRSKSAPPLGENYMIDRNKLIEEMKLRSCIKNLIKEEKSKRKKQETLLREYVRKIIKEASEDSDVPHNSTGINVLEDLLKKIIPVVEEDFKSLTTDKSQRNSFRSHIINAIQNTLIPSRVKKEIGDEETEPTIGEGSKDGEVDIKVGQEEEAPLDLDVPDLGPDAFIDVSKKSPKRSTFSTLPGEDLTGRNMALRTYEKIEKQISDAYTLLSNDEDENVFYDYLLTNMKLYFDKFEDELQSVVEEPTTPSYEKEKEDLATSPVEEPISSEDNL